MRGGVEWSECPLPPNPCLKSVLAMLLIPAAYPSTRCSSPHPVLCQLTLALPCPPSGKVTLSPIGPAGPGSTSVSGEAPQGNLSRSTS